ncbi:MAG: hypothetical protein AMJ79_03010 [Phycisphaerae bacterium SM23_30]|nr:MAG: hypothetical protein AMJ79_03010 [Phycisphaerae bacterium SM23_30]
MAEKVFVAKWYHMIFYPDWLRRLIEKPHRYLSELVTAGMRVADVGCGTGFHSCLLAEMVGGQGHVFAVDLQAEMLHLARKKAQRANLLDRITFRQCTPDDINLAEPLDFILTVYVVHEAPDRRRFLKQLRAILKPAGKYLLVEPKFHVEEEVFDDTCQDALDLGFIKISEPKIPFGYAALFTTAS